MKKTIFALSAAVYLLAATVTYAKLKYNNPGDLHPDEKQSMVCKLVVKMLSTGNYKKVPLNDSLSILVFDRYLKSLDENHSYLLAGDVSGFDQYRIQFDDDLKQGELTNVFAMYNSYKNRYEEYLRYSIEQLNTTFDFTKKDVFVLDRKKLPFVKTKAEINTIWKQRVKYDLLNLQLSNPDIAKNKEILKKKYQLLLEQSGRMSNKDVFQLFMNAFVASIDPHAAYFNPFNAEQFNVNISRSLEGIGATLALENDYVTIKTLTPGGPAYKSKLINPDDRIIAIAQGEAGQFQDIVGWRLPNVIELIRGPKGTTVKLKILSKGKAPSDVPQVVAVVREKIILADQSAKQEIRNYKNMGKDVKIGIISIPAFYIDYDGYVHGDRNYKSTTNDVRLLLDTLKKQHVNGIMIDLRGNGGGSLNEAISLTGLFIKKGPVVQVRDVKNHIKILGNVDSTLLYTGPLAILVDRTSASASEIFSGAIQDYGRGLILGAQTYGKGSVQTQYALDKIIASSVMQSGSVSADASQNQYGQLNVTIVKFYRINGSSTQHKGVIPDIELPSYISPSQYGEDIEPSAMPWDTIGRSSYNEVGSFVKAMPTLKSQYQQRRQTNVAYKAFENSVNAYQQDKAPASISLDEQEFKHIRNANTNKSLERDNELRVAIGLPPLKKGQVKAKTDDLDLMKAEAGQILTDYLSLDKAVSGQ